MKKLLVVTLAALAASICAVQAQQTLVTYTTDGVTTFDTAEQPGEVLDTTRFVVSYRMLYERRPENEQPMEDLLLLQVGRNVTKCYSYKTWQTDSLVRVTPPEQVLANLGSFHGGGGKIQREKSGCIWWRISGIRSISVKLRNDLVCRATISVIFTAPIPGKLRGELWRNYVSPKRNGCLGKANFPSPKSVLKAASRTSETFTGYSSAITAFRPAHGEIQLFHRKRDDINCASRGAFFNDHFAIGSQKKTL